MHFFVHEWFFMFHVMISIVLILEQNKKSVVSNRCNENPDSVTHRVLRLLKIGFSRYEIVTITDACSIRVD